MSDADPLHYENIRNTIALYCIALDTKSFDLLDQVFTSDVETVYPFGGKRTGVKDIKAAIEKRLSPVVTQHALTTQRIIIGEEGRTAQAVTYFTGIHFGQGKWAGKEVTAWGKYTDSLRLEKVHMGTQDPAEWRVCRREVSFMGRLGEEGVMEGE